MVNNFPLSLLIFKVNFSLSTDDLALVIVVTPPPRNHHSFLRNSNFIPHFPPNFPLSPSFWSPNFPPRARLQFWDTGAPRPQLTIDPSDPPLPLPLPSPQARDQDPSGGAGDPVLQPHLLPRPHRGHEENPARHEGVSAGGHLQTVRPTITYVQAGVVGVVVVVSCGRGTLRSLAVVAQIENLKCGTATRTPHLIMRFEVLLGLGAEGIGMGVCGGTKSDSLIFTCTRPPQFTQTIKLQAFCTHRKGLVAPKLTTTCVLHVARVADTRAMSRRAAVVTWRTRVSAARVRTAPFFITATPAPRTTRPLTTEICGTLSGCMGGSRGTLSGSRGGSRISREGRAAGPGAVFLEDGRSGPLGPTWAPNIGQKVTSIGGS